MSQDEKAAPAATTPEVRHSKFYWLASSVEEFELRQTLDAYEVEELDGHDLARFLPSILLREEGDDEIGGVSSD